MLQPKPNPDIDRASLRGAVDGGNIPTLGMVLHHLTGEDRWLRAPYAPTRTRGLSDHDDGGLEPEARRTLRDAAVEAILAWHNGRLPALPEPSQSHLQHMLSTCMGEAVPPEYAAMMIEEMGFRPARRPAPSTLRGRALSVLVIGAGISGLIAGRALREAGIPFEIIEKNDGIGGTWLENDYPGAGVDTPSYLYCFSGFPRNWSSHFAKRDEIHAYLEDMATHFDLHRSVRFGLEATSATFDSTAGEWIVETTDRKGAGSTFRANALITAVGLHNRPKTPNLPGLDRFAGPAFHTARWPEDVELGGKRVAVVGTGASAMQVVPATAEQVGRLLVFQRSPQWIAPCENYFRPITEDVHFLMEHAPYYHPWYRYRLAWAFNDRNHDALQRDPEWPHQDRAISRANDGHREYFTKYIREQLEGRPDLIAKSLPTYPPFGKRILLDNGWYAALRRPNVELIDEAVAAVTETGVVTVTGEEHAVDVLVLSTGFEQQRFLYPMHITGRDGVELRDAWDDDDARAYLGITVPGFPNLFLTYGPNTNPGGGSVIFTLERQINYIFDALRQMADRGLATIDCKVEPFGRYNDEVDAAHAKMVWTHPGMDTYYRNTRGRVVTNTPFRVVDYWHLTRSADLDDYQVELREAAPSTAGQRS